MTIHDVCPVCNDVAAAQCRCPKGDRICANGHHWHLCLAHDPPRVVLADADHSKGTFECSCLPTGDWSGPSTKDRQGGEPGAIRKAIQEVHDRVMREEN